MLAKILVALDGSPESESILPYIETLLRYQDADLTLVTVSPAGKPVAGMEAKGYLKEVAARLARKGAVVATEALTGHPADAIAAFAAGGRFDLVALSSRKGGLRRRLFGSVAEEILAGSQTPVLVLPPAGSKEAPPAIRKILVPLDGSHRSAAILKPVAALAKAFGSKLCFLTVVSPRKREELPVETMAHNLFGEQKALQAEGVEVEVAVLYGEPVERILNFAEENDVDLIALATHGRTGLDKVFFGNVAESVLRKSRRAMLVARSAAVSKTEVRSARAQEARHRSLEITGPKVKSPYSG
jgi:nucleotide-binding universal stress UspA family protein